jgi:hypothetical protein
MNSISILKESSRKRLTRTTALSERLNVDGRANPRRMFRIIDFCSARYANSLREFRGRFI